MVHDCEEGCVKYVYREDLEGDVQTVKWAKRV
jgi:hypothetical protein